MTLPSLLLETASLGGLGAIIITEQATLIRAGDVALRLSPLIALAWIFSSLWPRQANRPLEDKDCDPAACIEGPARREATDPPMDLTARSDAA